MDVDDAASAGVLSVAPTRTAATRVRSRNISYLTRLKFRRREFFSGGNSGCCPQNRGPHGLSNIACTQARSRPHRLGRQCTDALGIWSGSTAQTDDQRQAETVYVSAGQPVYWRSMAPRRPVWIARHPRELPPQGCETETCFTSLKT